MITVKRIAVLALITISFITMNAKKSYIFLAPGVEEIEATSTIDAMRRAQIPVVTVAVDTTLMIKGATGQTVVADSLLSDIDTSDADWLIVPGGMPGAPNLHASQTVNDMLLAHFAKGGRIASICAGPAIVLAPLGILKGKTATCYPGIGDKIEDNGGTYVKEPVVVDGNIITSEGPGTTLKFAKAIISATVGMQKADETMASMLVDD